MKRHSSNLTKLYKRNRMFAWWLLDFKVPHSSVANAYLLQIFLSTYLHIYIHIYINIKDQNVFMSDIFILLTGNNT